MLLFQPSTNLALLIESHDPPHLLRSLDAVAEGCTDEDFPSSHHEFP